MVWTSLQAFAVTCQFILPSPCTMTRYECQQGSCVKAQCLSIPAVKAVSQVTSTFIGQQSNSIKPQTTGIGGHKQGSMTDCCAVEVIPCSCTPVTLSCCTTMFSAQVPKQILTPKSVRCCLKACSMRTSRSVPKCGLPDTNMLCKQDKQAFGVMLCHAV